MLLNEILREATKQDLECFIKDLLESLEETMPKVHRKLILELHKNVYGSHFSKALVEEATSQMTGSTWTIDDTTKILKDYDLKENEYDFNYVMNMMKSDYESVIKNDLDLYVKLSCQFLNDKDAPEGKALKYYEAMSQE